MWQMAVAAQWTPPAFNFAEPSLNQAMPSARTSSRGSPQGVRGGARASLTGHCACWQGGYLLMESTDPLGSWPGSVLDVPFPFDDGTCPILLVRLVRTQARMVTSGLRVT